MIVGGILVKMFLLGSVMPAKRVTIIETRVKESKITIKGKFLQDSALAFRGFQYRIDGNNLYIKIYKTLISGKYKSGDADLEIKDKNCRDISNIYIEDTKDCVLIWSK